MQHAAISRAEKDEWLSELMQTYGDVTVVYNYTPVPEPATASLACAGLLMLLRRRRQA